MDMMISTINDVKAGDKIRFGEDSRVTHTIERIQYHSWEHSLRIVKTSQDSSITIPANAPVYVVQKIRPFKLACEGCGETHEILFDLVAGDPPRAVLCPGCPTP
jgi:hypothetical protein